MPRSARQPQPVEHRTTTVAVEWRPSPGQTHHWMCFNDGEVLCLAAGQVTDRMRLQAQMTARAIEEDQ